MPFKNKSHADRQALIRPHVVEKGKTKKVRRKDSKRYNKRWRKLSELIRTNEPLCRECKKYNRTTLAKCVDHIKPIELGGDMMDPANLQPLCYSCHNAKTAREDGGFLNPKKTH